MKTCSVQRRHAHQLRSKFVDDFVEFYDKWGYSLLFRRHEGWKLCEKRKTHLKLV